MLSTGFGKRRYGDPWVCLSIAGRLPGTAEKSRRPGMSRAFAVPSPMSLTVPSRQRALKRTGSIPSWHAGDWRLSSPAATVRQGITKDRACHRSGRSASSSGSLAPRRTARVAEPRRTKYAFAEEGAGRVVPVQLSGQIASRFFVEGHRAWAEMQGGSGGCARPAVPTAGVFWNPSALVTYFNALDASGRDLLRISASVDAPAATGRIWTTPSSWGEAHFCGEAALDALQRRRAGEDAERIYVLKDERGGNVLVVGARGAEMAGPSPDGYDAWVPAGPQGPVGGSPEHRARCRLRGVRSQGPIPVLTVWRRGSPSTSSPGSPIVPASYVEVSIRTHALRRHPGQYGPYGGRGGPPDRPVRDASRATCRRSLRP